MLHKMSAAVNSGEPHVLAEDPPSTTNILLTIQLDQKYLLAPLPQAAIWTTRHPRQSTTSIPPSKPPKPVSQHQSTLRLWEIHESSCLFQYSDIEEEITALSSISDASARSAAIDKLLTHINQLTSDVKDASTYLPAYDQRKYSEVHSYRNWLMS